MSHEISIELVSGSPAEAKVRDTLLLVRERFDLRKWEVASVVRISEGAVPHSHPVLTLGAGYPGEMAVASSYLHEQIHWWLASRWEASQSAIAQLRQRYPDAPVGPPEGAADEESSYLHYLVNYLELAALGELIGRERAAAFVRGIPYYRSIYATVVTDADEIGAICDRCGLSPS